ncbi:hypothetical protein [Hydrogenophaga sp.]|uniref:hypothetical protein n=1 Tax=Hydrogenophaga sp. TaxID=1904254 RepID=UPI0026246C78|nr:hypothetical protein [Hydrogenophaga sp.]MCW5653077.1 hypothetical protein [Hydrogenophaga sp.]
MNRCLSTTSPLPTRRRIAASLALAGCLGLLATGQAQAQAVQRSFPAKALRGAMVVTQPPLVTMDDRATRLAPGARILDASNKLVMPSTLINQERTVNYTLDQRGQVHQVWLLTDAEAKEKRAGFGTQRNFTFESQQTEAATSGTRAN